MLFQFSPKSIDLVKFYYFPNLGAIVKLLLIALTLTLSSQVFASDCDLVKKDFISADKISCDDTTRQVLIEGIKITKFGEEKNVVINGANSYTFEKSSSNICKAFGLKSAEGVEVKMIYSYLNTGIEIVFESKDSNNEYQTRLFERKQTRRNGPVKSIICNR